MRSGSLEATYNFDETATVLIPVFSTPAAVNTLLPVVTPLQFHRPKQ